MLPFYWLEISSLNSVLIYLRAFTIMYMLSGYD